MSRPIPRPRLRPAELGLLVLAAGVAVAASAVRLAAPGGPSEAGDLTPALVLAACFLVVHASLVVRGSRADPVLLPIVLCLMGLSLALIDRLAPDLAARHAIWQLVGIAALAATFHAPGIVRALRRYRYTWAIAGMVLVALTLVAGRSGPPGGPRLWLGVGTLQFQPSELLKVLLVAFLAGYLEDKRELLAGPGSRIGRLRLPPLPYLAPLAAMLGVSLALVAVQGDLGAALLLYAIGLGMLFLASSRVSYVAAGIALFLGGAWALYGRLGVVRVRVAIWHDPWSDAQGFGYQLVQALMAVAGGGVLGTGIGAGQPTDIPAVHNDMLYAALVEELGLAGSAAVLVLYTVLALRGFRIAVRARDPFERLLAGGLTFALSVQSLLIVGGVLKVVPLTGITLPFLSAGGSSLLVSAVAVGLLLRISDAGADAAVRAHAAPAPHDPLARNLRRVAFACAAGFVALAVVTAYWGLARSDELSARPDNLRRIAFDRRIRRGRILDRAGRVLAETTTEGDEEGDKEGNEEGNEVPTRRYPVPSAAPVVGYQTWRYGAGASGDVTYGAGGAEAAYDVALRGDLGMSPWQLAAARVLHRPQTGLDIVLALDAELQAYAAGLLGDREGAVVVVDVADGAVRALVSQPTFDPAALDAGELPGGEDAPMLVRATQGRYPPGSTWKAVTLAAALDEGLTDLDAIVDDGDAIEYFDGFPVRCDNNPDGTVSFDVAHAFAWSCNVTFARLGGELGADRYREYARRFGVDDDPPFPLPVARSTLSSDSELGLPELVSAAFGQGELMVTPLHMALITAAVAGDGSLPVPYLLADVPGVRWGRLSDDHGTWHRAVPAGTARAVREAMVVSATDGWAVTATEAAALSLGGKTGTAEVPDGAPHAWFIGFAPAEDPEVAIAVLVAHGGSGATVAAPLAGRVLARAVDLADSYGASE